MSSSAGSAAALLTRQERTGKRDVGLGHGRATMRRECGRHEGWDLLLVRLLLRFGRVQLRRRTNKRATTLWEEKKKEKGDRWS